MSNFTTDTESIESFLTSVENRLNSKYYSERDETDNDNLEDIVKKMIHGDINSDMYRSFSLESADKPKKAETDIKYIHRYGNKNRYRDRRLNTSSSFIAYHSGSEIMPTLTTPIDYNRDIQAGGKTVKKDIVDLESLINTTTNSSIQSSLHSKTERDLDNNEKNVSDRIVINTHRENISDQTVKNILSEKPSIFSSDRKDLINQKEGNIEGNIDSNVDTDSSDDF